MDPGACGYLHLASGMRTILLQKKICQLDVLPSQKRVWETEPKYPCRKRLAEESVLHQPSGNASMGSIYICINYSPQ